MGVPIRLGGGWDSPRRGVRDGTRIYAGLGRGGAGRWLSRLGWEGVGNIQYDC